MSLRAEGLVWNARIAFLRHEQTTPIVGPLREIVGGPLHGIQTRQSLIGGRRIYAYGEVEVWIPDTVPVGAEAVYIAETRILGPRS